MINGNVYRSMIVSAANNIANLQDEINKLNVFPVPDGDRHEHEPYHAMRRARMPLIISTAV